MRSFKVTLSYDGTDYCGWQVQPNGITIQEKIEVALACILGVRTRVTAAGRTDAGVHALGQVAGFSADTHLTVEQLQRAINGRLPPDIRVLQLQDAPPAFHAIRDAASKQYRYQFWDAPQHDVFHRRTHWHVRLPLDEYAMQRAAAYLLGKHDFVSFQAAGSKRATTTRTVLQISIQRDHQDQRAVIMEIVADGFLYNMVRNIAGTLVQVGRHVQPPEWVKAVLKARDRRVAGPTAPPHGLYLVRVDFSPSVTAVIL